MQLITISGKRKSGKSTLAGILRDEYGHYPISLATPLKNKLDKDFGLGYEYTDGALKESPTHYIDYSQARQFPHYYTPREIMIKMGAFYRSIDPDYWLKQLFQSIKEVPQAQIQTYVIPDVRFLNEINWMKRHDAFLVRLERDEKLTGPYINDPSETELDNYNGWDLKVPASHNQTIDDLYCVADQIYALTVH